MHPSVFMTAGFQRIRELHYLVCHGDNTVLGRSVSSRARFDCVFRRGCLTLGPFSFRAVETCAPFSFNFGIQFVALYFTSPANQDDSNEVLSHEQLHGRHAWLMQV